MEGIIMDCSKTENYLREKVRMTTIGNGGYCSIDCDICPLSYNCNNTGVDCERLEIAYPQKAIEIVQEWSDKHPQKTYLSEFLKHYPNVKIKNGFPNDICAASLGICENCEEIGKDGIVVQKRNCTCKECWNTPIE